jgi:hypothetical protein
MHAREGREPYCQQSPKKLLPNNDAAESSMPVVTHPTGRGGSQMWQWRTPQRCAYATGAAQKRRVVQSSKKTRGLLVSAAHGAATQQVLENGVSLSLLPAGAGTAGSETRSG